MAKSKKYIEPQEDRGAPEWMVTFSDCMTLLLTFFVLLLSFSSFDTDALDNVQQAFGIGCPNSAAQEGFRRGMLAKSEAIKIIEEIPEGSRIPTPSEKELGNLAKKRRLTDYQQQKVFSIPSEDIFAGNGSAIKQTNKAVLDYMAVFLKAKPSRVVICEFDPQKPDKSDKKGVDRSWAIMNYFVKSNINADRFSITGSSMLSRNDNLNERQLVITLLEEGIYE